MRVSLIGLLALLVSFVPSFYYAQEQVRSPQDELNQLVIAWLDGMVKYAKEHEKDMKILQIAKDIMNSSQGVFDGLKAAEDSIKQLKLDESTDEKTRIAVERYKSLKDFFALFRDAMSLLLRGFASQTGLLDESVAKQVNKIFEKARNQLAGGKD